MLTPKAASRPESLIRYAILDSDLPAPEVQLPIRDRRGRAVAHADLGYEEWRIAIEYEGRQHADPKQFGRDLARYTLMGSNGWLLLRFGAADAFRPWRVVARVGDALRSRGARW
jgi:very-short-patch-repair endonuclease